MYKSDSQLNGMPTAASGPTSGVAGISRRPRMPGHRLSGRSVRVGLAGLVGALAIVLGSAAPAFASTTSKNFDATDSGLVEVAGSITFNSNGTASSSATGADYAADGFGPYLYASYYLHDGSVKNVTVGCAAGAGNFCIEPVTSGGSSSNAVTKVKVEACTGKGGQTYLCGPIITLDNPYN